MIRLLLAILLLAGSAEATDRYVSNSGTAAASACTVSTGPYCAPVTALSASVGGDTVWFTDGTYQGANYMLTPGSGVSGTSTSNRITARPVTDGNVTIDGEFARSPCEFVGNSYWTVTGFNCKNAGPSNQAVLYVRGASNNNQFLRMVVWDAKQDENNTCLQVFGSDTNLFQDIAVFGTCRFSVNPFQGQFNTFDRMWIRWEGSTAIGPKGALTNAYGGFPGFNSTFQNVLITWSPLSMPQNYTLGFNGGAWIASSLDSPGTCVRQADNSWNCTDYSVQSPGGISHNEGNPGENLQTVMGGVLVYIRNSDVSFLGGSAPNAYPLAMAYHLYSNTQTFSSMFFYQDSAMTSPSSIFGLFLGSSATTSGNSLLRGTAVRSGVDSIASEWTVSPALASSSTLGGLAGSANIFTSSVNANLCYLWNGGSQTSTPMWPWSMNDRIKAATAAAGTYAGPCLNCTGSRQARTQTDVTADIEAIFGTIPSACRTTPGGSPSFPVASDFPAQPIVDTFTRANNPELGADWTNLSGAGFSIVSNIAVGGATFSRALYTASQVTGSSHEVYATMPSAFPCCFDYSTILSFAGTDLSTNNQYRLYLRRTAGANASVQIQKVDSVGTATVLSGSTIDLGLDITDNNGFGIRVASNVITIYWKWTDGVWYRVGQVTDSTLPTGNVYVGIAGVTTETLDDFGAGPSPSAPPPTPAITGSGAGRFGTTFPGVR